MKEREQSNSTNPKRLRFEDFVIREDGEEMLAQCAEETFFLEPLALMGQMTMIYAPPSSGKSLITLSLARAFQCRFITSTPTTKAKEQSPKNKVCSSHTESNNWHPAGTDSTPTC